MRGSYSRQPGALPCPLVLRREGPVCCHPGLFLGVPLTGPASPIIAMEPMAERGPWPSAPACRGRPPLTVAPPHGYISGIPRRNATSNHDEICKHLQCATLRCLFTQWPNSTRMGGGQKRGARRHDHGTTPRLAGQPARARRDNVTSSISLKEPSGSSVVAVGFKASSGSPDVAFCTFLSRESLSASSPSFCSEALLLLICESLRFVSALRTDGRTP